MGDLQRLLSRYHRAGNINAPHGTLFLFPVPPSLTEIQPRAPPPQFPVLFTQPAGSRADPGGRPGLLLGSPACTSCLGKDCPPSSVLNHINPASAASVVQGLGGTLTVAGLASKVVKAGVALAHPCHLVWHQALVAVGDGLETGRRVGRREKILPLSFSSLPVTRLLASSQFVNLNSVGGKIHFNKLFLL